MINRRNFLKVTAGGAGLLGPASAMAYTPHDLLQYLCPPNNLPDQLAYEPSPPVRPFVTDLFIPPILPSKPLSQLQPPADPRAHQLWGQTVPNRTPGGGTPASWDLTPQSAYELKQKEFKWIYHTDAPYDKGTWSWGWQGSLDPQSYPYLNNKNAKVDNNNPNLLSALAQAKQSSSTSTAITFPMTPGPTIHATYGKALLVRQINELPPIGNSKATFALPSTTIHLHNGHQASESDGNPQDWIDSGEFWDHHYGLFPSGGNSHEKLSTLWYHDHRLDFTASNVYAGLSGFFLYFDDEDTGDETNPAGWQLPSGEFDIPLIFHDVKFDKDGQAVFNNFYTDGWLGDRITINRTILPKLTVQRRKYRFRILNGGPSRFYQFGLSQDDPINNPFPVIIITGDGNFLPEPVIAKHWFMSVAQRFDIVIDFSVFNDGDQIYLWNVLEQTNGKGPSGRQLDPKTDKEQMQVMRFDVVEMADGESDASKVPTYFRSLPEIPADLSTLNRRTWDFDYDGGLWTINGLVMDPNRIDAGIVKNSTEIWTFRNTGNDWSHPVHIHFTEFMILEINGKPYPYHTFVVQEAEDGKYFYVALPPPTRTSESGVIAQRRSESTSGTKMAVQYIDTGMQKELTPIDLFMGGPRRDVATILPGDQITAALSFMDFEGRHVMHCHNVVHEDHAMMIRWDILPEGQITPINESVPASQVWKAGLFGETSTSDPNQRPYTFRHQESRPAAAKDIEPSRGSGNFPPQAPPHTSPNYHQKSQ